MSPDCCSSLWPPGGAVTPTRCTFASWCFFRSGLFAIVVLVGQENSGAKEESGAFSNNNLKPMKEKASGGLKPCRLEAPPLDLCSLSWPDAHPNSALADVSHEKPRVLSHDPFSCWFGDLCSSRPGRGPGRGSGGRAKTTAPLPLSEACSFACRMSTTAHLWELWREKAAL